MADQPDATPHIRITRASITLQGSPAEQPRTFTRHIECSGNEETPERSAAAGGRGENMRNREGEDRGRRRSS